VYRREDLRPGQKISGPAIIAEPAATTVCELGWQFEVSGNGDLILVADDNDRRLDSRHFVGAHCMRPLAAGAVDESPDPVLLELFNALFMFIAEQMGLTLQQTSHSVNIKERLDFSCALFDGQGNLIANAPHIPVHLGSMGASVKQLMRTCGSRMQPGDSYALNDPYNGGTHLPDITVITPHFDSDGNEILFFFASRGHHADIGGITPGSMPPGSKHIDEEGILINDFLLVRDGKFQETALLELLSTGKYPARNPRQNIADLKSQVAANARGISELNKVIEHYGLATVQSYMQFVQSNAEQAVRRVLSQSKSGRFESITDTGARIVVSVAVDQRERTATFDFAGTSSQQADNFNAPASICRAAVIYALRTLVADDIPLNDGCMVPVKLIIPEGSMLNPSYPAAVVAGNVETSQIIVDTIFGALGVLAGSQGTMNNFTFGNAKYQYYETICGGSGAGNGFNGCSGVQTHMTNSRLTDPEVLENRFPVTLESFSLRKDSGGPGKFHGGDGVIRKLRFNEKMVASILSGRRNTSPHGIDGGKAGLPGKNHVLKKDGIDTNLGPTATMDVNPGDVFIIETPGGGGFGGTSGI
jgi:5-oxoprolinase (ATP-hydrolysing)